MPDALTIAAALVVAGPVVGTVCLAYPRSSAFGPCREKSTWH